MWLKYCYYLLHLWVAFHLVWLGKMSVTVNFFNNFPELYLQWSRPYPKEGKGTVFTYVCLSTRGKGAEGEGEGYPCSLVSGPFPSEILKQGYPLPWPGPRQGCPPPPPGQDMSRTGYSADGMPLAFSHRTFLLDHNFVRGNNEERSKICVRCVITC